MRCAWVCASSTRVSEAADSDVQRWASSGWASSWTTEILVHKKAVSAATQQLLHQECPQALITPIDPNSAFSAAALVALVQAAGLFDNPSDPQHSGTWPEALAVLMDDGKSFRAEFECCVSALYLCVKYLQRCCVANLLMSERAFFFVDSIDEGV